LKRILNTIYILETRKIKNKHIRQDDREGHGEIGVNYGSRERT
jgi:hypothetical protein